MSLENKNENRYVKKSIDYSSYECGEEMDILSNSDCIDLLDDCIEEDEIHDTSLSDEEGIHDTPLIDDDEIQRISLCGEDEIHDAPLCDDVDELAMLGFFSEFTLMDIGIGEFIREIYFED